MLDLDSSTLSAAHRAVQKATSLYLFNPRVSLIDFGLRIRDQHDSRLTDEPCLRIHLRDKPRGEQLEMLAAERPNLYLPDEQLRSLVKDYPFEVDLPLGDYTPHRATGSWSPLRGTDPPTVVRHDGIFDPLVGSSAIHNLA